MSLGAAAATLIASPLEAAVRAMPERALNLYNIHTGEWLKTVYWSNGKYLPKSLTQVNRFLRDHRSGDVHPIDPQLVDLMMAVHRKFGNKGALHIISGYRSPATNAMLEAASDGVAHQSLHMAGRAVDIRVPGTSVKTVGRAARSLKAGGVGTYPSSNFVHIDTGRVRTWG
ncbi:MAG: YcbK family protein [Solirubrobacterales bacterium]